MDKKIGTLTRAEFNRLTEDEKFFLLSNSQEKVVKLEKDIANYKELYLLRCALKYVPSTEQTGFLFNELEVYQRLDEKPETITVKEHTKLKPKKKECQLPPQTPIYEVDHTKDALASFIKDGIEYKRSEDRLVNRIASIPQRFVVECHRYAQYEPQVAEEKRLTLWDNSKTDAISASPSFIADMLVKKFDDHLPFYRQEEILQRNGLHMTRQKMASWAIAYYDVLLPLEKIFKKHIYGSKLINKDETRLLVLDVKGPHGKPSTNGFAYITIGTTYDEKERKYHRLMFIDYIQGRCTDVLLEDYKSYQATGFVMTDGLAQYTHMEKHCCCWVHGIRAFKQLYKTNKKNKDYEKLILLFNGLYTIEDTWRAKLHSGEITPAEFLSKRKEEANKVIDDIYSYLDEICCSYTSESETGKAIAYINSRRDDLRRYLEVLESSPDNNACEQTAKAFACGRKNWLFSTSEDGADASCFFFSLIETAKLYGIAVDEYMEYVCTYGPSCKTEQDWEILLPWKVNLDGVKSSKAKRIAALKDPNRTEPYIFRGVTH